MMLMTLYENTWSSAEANQEWWPTNRSLWKWATAQHRTHGAHTHTYRLFLLGTTRSVHVHLHCNAKWTCYMPFECIELSSMANKDSYELHSLNWLNNECDETESYFSDWMVVTESPIDIGRWKPYAGKLKWIFIYKMVRYKFNACAHQIQSIENGHFLVEYPTHVGCGYPNPLRIKPYECNFYSINLRWRWMWNDI